MFFTTPEWGTALAKTGERQNLVDTGFLLPPLHKARSSQKRSHFELG
jgi:hypothetical protein